MLGLLGLGASLGACVRYFLTNVIKKYQRINFPLATLILNVTGAFLLGVLVGAKTLVGSELYNIIGTGFLGGYTTFSTFNTELFTLLHNRQFTAAFLYGGLSYIIGIGCAFLGFFCGSQLN